METNKPVPVFGQVERYILVQWPDSQDLMDQPWFGECIFCIETDQTMDPGGSAYMCPENRYNQLYGNVDEELTQRKFEAEQDLKEENEAAILREGVDVFGTEQEFKEWYNKPNAFHNFKKPSELTSEEIMTELGRIRNGIV